MPTMLKPRTLGVLTKVERRRTGASFIVTAFGQFDLAEPQASRFETDQAMWVMAAKALPQGHALDIGMPKPQAEMLIGGSALAPGGVPVPGMMLEWRVGPLHKRVAILGDRYWQFDNGSFTQTAPKPFTEMKLDPERAFGGADHPDNPKGVGFKAAERIRARLAAPLPNIELPDRMIRAIDHSPPPALCGPADLANPKRRRYAGTYDDHWIKQEAPGLPEDVDPRFFLLAPEDQRFPGFLRGGEAYALRGFAKDEAELSGTLPDFRVRGFLARAGDLAEIVMRIDTLWLMAGARRGVLIYRGALPVQDFDAEDVSHVMLAYEHGRDAPRAFDHYQMVFGLRADRKQAFKHAFSESQLAPALSPEVVALRNKERGLQQQARLDKHQQGQIWIMERRLREAGLPKALVPALPPPDPDLDLAAFPMPTPEELQEGDIDLAAILDAVEALQQSLTAKRDAAEAKMAPMVAALTGLKAPEADPAAVDALFAALDGLGLDNPAGSLDAAFSAGPPPDDPMSSGPAAPSGAAAKLAATQDWRRLMLDAAKGPVIDEEAEIEAARGRFLDLPAFRPMAAMRAAVTQAGADLPDFASGDAPPAAAEAPRNGQTALTALLDDLKAESPAPAALAGMDAKRDTASRQLREKLPHLSPEGSGLDALLDALSPAREAPAAHAQAPQAAITGALADLPATLDAAEAKLVTGLAEARRLSPAALFPKQRLTRGAARRFGAAILEAHRDGTALRGRDMAGADLSGADLTGADLEGAFLEGADLTGARLRGARLADAALTGAVLDAADCSDTDLSGANLAKAQARGTNFSRARLIKSKVMEADFTQSRFEGARLQELQAIKVKFDDAAFGGAHVDRCIFMQGGFERTLWYGAALHRLQFLQVSLAAASLREASLERCAFLDLSAPGVDFSGARLSHCAFLGEADLAQACFEAATGETIGFTKAKLRGARFAQARFDACNFGEADLTGADFRLASLKGSLFGRAHLAGADLLGANLFGAQMRRADCSGARLHGANLYAAILQDADLTGADLSLANLGRTMLAVDTHVG